jgi:hypothetical protein
MVGVVHGCFDTDRHNHAQCWCRSISKQLSAFDNDLDDLRRKKSGLTAHCIPPLEFGFLGALSMFIHFSHAWSKPYTAHTCTLCKDRASSRKSLRLQPRRILERHERRRT